MANDENVKSTIASDIEIVGSIQCASHIRLDGKLEGDLTCTGNAVIGDSATVKGNLAVESISIMGEVTGNVTARDRIELKSTARLTGDIQAKRLTVEDGVTFVGKSEVNPSGAKPAGASNRPREAEQGQAGEPGETGQDKGKGGAGKK